jgi:hypothetical protein
LASTLALWSKNEIVPLEPANQTYGATSKFQADMVFSSLIESFWEYATLEMQYNTIITIILFMYKIKAD